MIPIDTIRELAKAADMQGLSTEFYALLADRAEFREDANRLTAERDAANAVIEELIVALQHHQEQTRPIHGTQIALDAARALRKVTT